MDLVAGWRTANRHLYLDYEKAFDKVPHKRLLYKLDHFVGIRGQVLSLIVKTHSSRTFRVRVQYQLSKPKPLHSGVVQGSVLGPLLLTCYIADLGKALQTQSQSFAVDRKVYCNPLTDLDKFMADLRTLEIWTQDWLMKLLNVQFSMLEKATHIINTVSITLKFHKSENRETWEW